MRLIPVTVLGATGVVGQRFVRRLAAHPFFRVVRLCASDRSSGRRYADACEWRLPGDPYAGFADLVVEACDPTESPSPVVFSALDADAAREIEPRFAAAGSLVFSNAAAFRMEEDVPLVVPELNADHMALVEVQRARRGWEGAVVCNPNCTTAVALGALGPLHHAFGLEAATLTSMQALSGAGYPGVASLDALGNVVPFIRGEEAKVETEARKILGTLADGRVEPARFAISAQCNRVPVADGHTICAGLRLRGSPTAEAVADALRDFMPATAGLGLWSAPRSFVRLRTEENRPQPRRDVEDDGGMTVHVGRVRPCPVLGVKLVALGHNVERGAAGASVLNAELAVARGIA